MHSMCKRACSSLPSQGGGSLRADGTAASGRRCIATLCRARSAPPTIASKQPSRPVCVQLELLSVVVRRY
jgi:hypothetical protein